MKNLAAMLLGEAPFSEVAMGNTAVVRAMMESGVRVVASYPGSPTPEMADAIGAIPPDRRPFRFEFSVNEKVALEVAFGAALNGHLSACFFKSVGLNVAADSFVQLPLMDIPGGLVVVLGDDPGANSSQNEQDNRHYARMSYAPMLEPADAREAYAFFKLAASMARERRTAVALRLTTHVCHAKERIDFDAWTPAPFDGTPRFDPTEANRIPLAAAVHPLKRRALERLGAIAADPAAASANRLLDHGNRDRGVVTAGTAYLSLLDAIEGADRKPDVLKLGLVHPLPAGTVLDFLRTHAEVKVLEELDPVLETEIKALAFDAGLRTRIIGKRDLDERLGEYVPEKVRRILAATWPDLVSPGPERLPEAAPARPPQLCPGCGHRSAFHAVRRALAADAITVSDIGCHTLGYLPPYSMGTVLLSMGHSTSTASGLSVFNEVRKVVCFMGDSTFFHAGIPGIVNAVYNRHRVTLVVMENGTTAMTGHQDHPGTGRNFDGDAPRLSIRAVLEALGVASVREVDAYKQAELTEAIRAATAEDGFSVVIARHPCMLKLTRDARRKAGAAWKPSRVAVDQDVCVRARVCVAEFGCPSFQVDDGKVTVSRELCIGDGSCRQTCPTGAIAREGEGGA